MFPKYYSRNNKIDIQNKSLVDLAYREWIFNIKNKPQVAKDPNNYNKPKRNINEFEQVPIKEEESSPSLQKFFLLKQKKKKNTETNKAKKQMYYKENEKTLKKTLEKLSVQKKNLPVYCR